VHSLVDMNSHEENADGGSTARTGSHANGASRIRWRDLGQRVKAGVSGFSSNLGDRIKKDPYKTLGLAAAAGVGVGIVLGSRILRTVVASTVSYGIVELARAYLRQKIAQPDAAPGVHT
jgi:ElaB/YqjD/DUF883 family membrane-anchored ribosome-binding protein